MIIFDHKKVATVTYTIRAERKRKMKRQERKEEAMVKK